MDFLINYISSTAWAVFFALMLDRLLGEPKGWHPLIWFGNWARLCRDTVQAKVTHDSQQQRRQGIQAWCASVLPWLVILMLLLWLLPPLLEFLLSVVVLYFAIGWQSLREHTRDISDPLSHGWLEESRTAVGRIVSRDTQSLNAEEIAKAGIESVLENGSDAIFAPIFWFVLLGPFGALLYRLANTLDAMWGYKTAELLHFGWFSARFDDVLNWLPARLVVWTYGVLGNREAALRCANTQGKGWKSPNAGPVMAAGAGALGIQLGGAATYFGQVQQRPVLGEGQRPQAADLTRAIQLVDKGVWLWLAVIFVFI